ncbi:hypothetical protein B0H13DRAFT_2343574 [Mycena leptocephala]|nr:hypothetical protein B0H13DRAFT_2343574 [Mycena leptocephala]
MACSLGVFHAASPDGAECGNKSRAAHSFSEIYSSALRSFPSIQSCPRSMMGARGARIVFGAFCIERLRVPDSTRHSLVDFPHYWRVSTHKHTVARKIEWAAFPMLVYLCIRAWSITPRATPVRSPIVGGRVERLSKTHARERAEAERGTPLPPSKHPSALDVFSASRYSLNSHSSDAGSQGKKGQPRDVLSLPLLPFHSHSTRASAPAAASLFTPLPSARPHPPRR